jgi:hypothetical protein
MITERDKMRMKTGEKSTFALQIILAKDGKKIPYLHLPLQ